MLAPSQIIERFCSGQAGVPSDDVIRSTNVLPKGWTDLDTRQIGLPVVIGHSDTGFVGAVDGLSRADPFPWIAESSHDDFAKARAEVIAQATHMKQRRART